MDGKKLPGTTIECNLTYDVAEKIFEPMFLTGGLVLSQITEILGIEGYMIHNWIKRKYLVPPVNKKYSKNQFSRLVIINMLKDSFTFDQIVKLLGYVNGALDDHSDDTIDDYDLYNYFINTLVMSKADGSMETEKLDLVIEYVVEGYIPKYDFSKNRLKLVIKIMVTSYQSILIKEQAMVLFSKLDYD